MKISSLNLKTVYLNKEAQIFSALNGIDVLFTTTTFFLPKILLCAGLYPRNTELKNKILTLPPFLLVLSLGEIRNKTYRLLLDCLKQIRLRCIKFLFEISLRSKSRSLFNFSLRSFYSHTTHKTNSFTEWPMMYSMAL